MDSKRFLSLKNKFVARHQDASKRLYENHKEAVDWAAHKFPNKVHKIITGAVGGLVLTTAPVLGPLVQHASVAQTHTSPDNHELAERLGGVVPDVVRPLSNTEDSQISQLLTDQFGFRVIPNVGGIRLNATYGLIGAEQHLPRFPGDTVFRQMETTSDYEMFGDSGMTPGLGAWGYFAPSESQFSQKDKEREKYYIAVQTFLAPGFNDHVAEYRDFFKYRKMLVVNPKTGQAVICDIADAGPSPWTGKQLGGSPEVMYSLGLDKGPRKGAVLYYFIDDPSDSIPLGPVHTQATT